MSYGYSQWDHNKGTMTINNIMDMPGIANTCCTNNNGGNNNTRTCQDAYNMYGDQCMSYGYSQWDHNNGTMTINDIMDMPGIASTCCTNNNGGNNNTRTCQDAYNM